MNPEEQNQPGSQEKRSENMPAAPVQKANDSFAIIKHVTAWVMIISAILFALIGVLAIWQVFGDNAGDVVWRAFSSLAIIVFAALVVNIASRVAEGKR